MTLELFYLAVDPDAWGDGIGAGSQRRTGPERAEQAEHAPAAQERGDVELEAPVVPVVVRVAEVVDAVVLLVENGDRGATSGAAAGRDRDSLSLLMTRWWRLAPSPHCAVDVWFL